MTQDLYLHLILKCGEQCLKDGSVSTDVFANTSLDAFNEIPSGQIKSFHSATYNQIVLFISSNMLFSGLEGSITFSSNYKYEVTY